MKSNQKKNRFINIKEWNTALQQSEPQKAVFSYFEKFYGKSKQLQKAIDDSQSTNNLSLVLCCLETLSIFSKAQKMDYYFYIRQILQSQKFKKMLEHELEAIEKKYKVPIRRCNTEKEFINYFVNFTEEYIKHFTEDIIEYVNRFYKTVQILQENSGQFDIQEEKLKDFLDFLNQEIQSNQQKEQGENQIYLQSQFDLYQKQQDQIRQQYEKVFGVLEVTDSKEVKNGNCQIYNFSQKVFQQRLRQNYYSQNGQATYHEMPVEPSIKELISSEQYQQVYGGKIFDLQQQDNINLEQFLNNHFFILREDCYSGLRKALYSLKQNNFKLIENVVLENVYLYQQVIFEDVEASYSGLRFKISMKLSPQNKQGLCLNHKKMLMSGSLIILTTQSFSVMIFAQVVNIPFKIENDRITQMIKFLNLSTQQQLESVKTLMNLGENIYAIESKVFYESYCHYLQCLKQKKITTFPFEDQIVRKKKDIPFINCFKDSYYLYLSNKQQENKFLQVDVSDLLDPSQLKAVQQFLSKGIALIQGPPGTGKTHCSALGVKILLENGFEDDPKKELVYDFDLVGRHFENTRKYGKLTEKPILVVCQTNHALDQFLKHILQFCHESHVVRLGGRCKDSDLDNVLFKTYKQSVVIKHDWKEAHKIKKKLEKKAQSILNLNQTVHSSHLEFFYPKLADKIVKQYLYNENLIYQNLSEKSRQSILTFWLKGLQPNEKLRNLIVDNEYYGQNQLFSQRSIYQEQSNTISINDLDSVVESSKNLNETLDLEDGFVEIEPDVESDSENETFKLQQQKNENEEKNLLDDIFKQEFRAQVAQNNYQSLKVDDISKVFQQISDIKVEAWKISLENRSYLKAYMINQLSQTDLVDFSIGQKYEKELQKIKVQSDLVDECFLRTKKVVGVTLTGCAKYMDLLQRIEFNTLIIEEAGEVLESHLVSILQKHINHLILIGDHQQLKPHLQNYDLEVKYRANVSLFERLIKNGVEYITLGYQRRMKTKLADFIRLIYKEYNDHSTIQELNKIKVKGMKDDLIFFNHSKLEDPDNENSSKSNQFEAQMVVMFSQYLIKVGISAQKITILTTYRKQAQLIQSKVSKELRVSTIDDYQGEENDIILLSLVRSNDKYQLGFVAIDNRICVAFSRAKIGFYVFGNFQFIQESIVLYLQQPKQDQKEGTSDLWLKIIQLAQQKNVLLNHLPLHCSIHDQSFQVFDIQDWSKYQGGCSKTCGQLFPCGHQCKENCHFSDHKQSQCKEICEKVLDCGHLCKSFCGIQQFKCQMIIEKQYPQCNHKIQLKCFQANMSLICDKKCEKLLKCGHQCQGQCYEDCEQVNCCQVPIQLKLNCNHTKEIKCGEQHQIQNLICYEKCQKTHTCKNSIQQQVSTCRLTCGTCLNGFECQCLEICKKNQFCGHQCEKACQQDCFGCEKICQYSCNRQIQCQKLCYQRCMQCQNNCQISCIHTICTKKCYEICDRLPCNERCELILPCGCQCMGLCGEQCPQICMDSSHETEQAMQDERYYQLECKNQCVYSVSELDSLIRDDKAPMINCKKCKTTIWSSRRYQDIFKKIMDVYNRQKLEKYAKQEITMEQLILIGDLVKSKLDYLKNNKLKDHDNFLDNIQRKIQNNINFITKNQKLELNHENIKSILKQLQYYEKSRIIQCLESENKEFNRQVFVLSKFYLLNEDFQNQYNEKLWDQIENKIQSLFLFYELDQYLKKRVSLIYYQFREEILKSNFMLSEEQMEDLQDQMYR